QSSAFRLSFGIWSEFELRRLERVADAGMQSYRVDRPRRSLPCPPLRAQGAANAIHVLYSRCLRDYASAVHPSFIPRFMGHVPPETGEQGGVGRELEPGLWVGAKKGAVIQKADGSLGVDGVDIRRLADAVEQQPQTVAQAVRIGAPDEQIDACRQIQSG